MGLTYKDFKLVFKWSLIIYCNWFWNKWLRIRLRCNKSERYGRSISQLTGSRITTIEQQRSLSMRCQNVSKPPNNKPTILIGNSIVLQKAKSFTIMPWQEDPVGNFPTKSSSTSESYKSKRKRKGKLMEVSRFNKNSQKNNKKRKNSPHFLKLNASMPTPNGSLASRCVRMINDGCSWKLVTRRNYSMTIFQT